MSFNHDMCYYKEKTFLKLKNNIFLYSCMILSPIFAGILIMMYIDIFDKFNLNYQLSTHVTNSFLHYTILLKKMETSSSQRRKSNRIPKPINFDDYDDTIFEDDAIVADELNEEEGIYEKYFL